MEADSPIILIKIGGSTLGSEDTSFADVAALHR
ncbi:MAG: acetylglutamate kinase, partial [Chloroflexi bacterium]|nr:acetylglutamate kinase [Chloroflexota bacterium]